ncbi:hypothetical protein Avbf_02702 [Armadillidium vulgare]|nr:hypothetical protein Avbf_02702 [Armadillidium vulgare]
MKKKFAFLTIFLLDIFSLELFYAADEKNNILSSSIWFKFKEGYSNAVRRPLKRLNIYYISF